MIRSTPLRIVLFAIGVGWVACAAVLRTPGHTAAHLRSLGYANVELDNQSTKHCGRSSTGYSFHALSPSGRLVRGLVCASFLGYSVYEIQ